LWSMIYLVVVSIATKVIGHAQIAVDQQNSSQVSTFQSLL
jgi:hypothetical protein